MSMKYAWKRKVVEDGIPYPAHAFMYVPDRSKPSSWKVRYKEYVEGKGRERGFLLLKVTENILDMAEGALNGGYFDRGEIPQWIKDDLLYRINDLKVNSLGIRPAKAKEKIKIEGEKEARTPELITEHYEGLVEDTFEEVTLSTSTVEVDREAGILKNVAFLSLRSKNDREYMEAGVVNAINRGIYENLPCYADHKKGQKRSILEAMGTWKGARWDADTRRGRADLHLLKEWKNRVIDFVDHGPTLAAPSHVVLAKVRIEKKDGIRKEYVEEIGKGYSIDLVAGAATVDSITEQEKETETMVDKKIEPEKIKEYVGNDTLTQVLEELETSRGENKELKDQIKEFMEGEKNRRAQATSRKELEIALKDSSLPEEIRQEVLEAHGEDVFEAGQVKTLVEKWEALVDKARKGAKPKVNLEETEEEKKARAGKPKVNLLAESMKKIAGIKTAKEIEEEKKAAEKPEEK